MNATPYTLTLTQDERNAIDWIGNRYAHGDQLREALSECTTDRDDDEYIWDFPGDVTFNVRESIAWDICRALEESDFRMDCFGDDLRAKLFRFAEAIV